MRGRRRKSRKREGRRGRARGGKEEVRKRDGEGKVLRHGFLGDRRSYVS